MTELLLLSGVELGRRIARRELSSRDAVDAHIAQIERVNPTINAVVAERFEAARREADAADASLAREPDAARSPFFGVPCTIKECFALEGMPNTAGLVARKGVPATEDATAVRRLRAAGAIPMGVTNTSELCMWMESNNRVYGRTRNPYDATRIVGGSSGGEGAIIAAGGAPFGLGSDIGGSIRLPAFFNGVFGHKPTGGMVPGSGQFPMAENQALRYLTTGPLARRAEDLLPFLRIVAGADGLDEGTLPLPIGDPAHVDVRGMRVLVVENNGLRRPTAPMKEALRRSAEALEARGAIVETREIAAFKRSFQLWSTLLGAANEHHTFRGHLVAGKRKSMAWETMKLMFGRSDHTLPAIVLAGVEPLSSLVGGSPVKAQKQLDALKADIDEAIGDGVLLHPPYTRPAPKHDAPLWTPLDFVYTGLFNVLELPATHVPTGLSDEGLPVGVQVVARHGADHRAIAVACALEESLGGWTPPACVPR